MVGGLWSLLETPTPKKKNPMNLNIIGKIILYLNRLVQTWNKSSVDPCVDINKSLVDSCILHLIDINKILCRAVGLWLIGYFTVLALSHTN